MQKIKDFDKVEASGDFESIEPGAYVAMITSVEDHPDKQYLEIGYDIAEGEHAGMYSDDWGKNNLWAHRFMRSYKDSALGFFKRFINDVEASTPDFKFDFNDARLITCRVGIILQNELTTYNGEDKKHLVVFNTLPADKVRSGGFKMPKVRDKREKRDSYGSATDLDDDAIPF